MSESRVRLVTVDMACVVVRQVLLTAESTPDYFQQQLYPLLIEAKETIVTQLVTYYKATLAVSQLSHLCLLCG